VNLRRTRAAAVAAAAASLLYLAASASSPARAGALPGQGVGLLSLANGGELDFSLAVNPSLPVPVLTPDPSLPFASSLHVSQVGSGASYKLWADSNLAAADQNTNGPQVILDVSKGQIVPPLSSDGKTTLSPLSILSTSAGLDQNHLIVGLREDTSSGVNPPPQLLGLSFFNLLPPPTVTVTAPTNNTAATSTTAPDVSHNSVPEPTTVALWSVVVGLGLVRAQAARRRAR
jgi:hypothetical protein